MTEHIRQSLRESRTARWAALVLASFAIFGAYYFNYALSSVKPVLESVLGWNSQDFGTYTSAYGWFNVFLFMLIISGFILDKLGIRKTGLGATLVMFIGTAINYWAISHKFGPDAIVHLPLVGDMKTQVLISAFGFAIFGVGTEAIGITISKAVVRWFKGKEMATAMGMQMSIARLGTMLALLISLPLAKNFTVTAPILFALIVMLLGVVSFIAFSILDIRLDKSESKAEQVVSPEDEFKISDIKLIISNRGFWYIAILCVLFYSAVFPFLYYATDLMINKYNVNPYLAGTIPGLLPLGTIFLTPLFGGVYDKYGKGATIMILGSLILILVHGVLAIPFLQAWWIAAVMVIILGIGFSLVPSAMWPSVPKIIPEKQLGTAYAVIFWIQNIGLLVVPLILGFVLNATNPEVSPNKLIVKSAIEEAMGETWNQKNLDPGTLDLVIEKTTGQTIDSIVQYTRYEPEHFAEGQLEQLEGKIKTHTLQALQEVSVEGDQNVVEERFIAAGHKAAFDAVREARLNLRYDYFYDILIFFILALSSLLFAFLLRIEDRKKDYGLEKPNIVKQE